MRETIYDNRLADLSSVKIDPSLSARERYAEYRRQLNDNPYDYMLFGFTIHETFDQTGPEFVDCVVRIAKC